MSVVSPEQPFLVETAFPIHKTFVRESLEAPIAQPFSLLLKFYRSAGVLLAIVPKVPKKTFYFIRRRNVESDVSYGKSNI